MPEGIHDKYWIEAIEILKKSQVKEMENLLLSIYEKLFLFTFQKDHQYEMFGWVIEDLSYEITSVFDYPKDRFDDFLDNFKENIDEYIKFVDETYEFNQDNIDKVYETAKRNYSYYVGGLVPDDCGVDLDALRTFPELLDHMNFFNYFKRFIDWR
jgi:hypothetical protein